MQTTPENKQGRRAGNTTTPMQTAVDSPRASPRQQPLQIEPTSPERIAALHAIRDRHPGNEGQHQRHRALEALQTLGHLTTFEGTRHLDCYDVRARVMELRRAGHQIITTWRQVPTESGRLHRIGVYVLHRGQLLKESV